MDLYAAIGKVDESLGLAPSLSDPAPADVPTVADNNRALADIQRMMGGIR